MNVTLTAKNLEDIAAFKITPESIVDGWLNTRAVKLYSKAQKQRWISEGSSEGSLWEPLSRNYNFYKMRKFYNYPGRGTKLLMATSNLFASVLPPDERGGYAALDHSRGGDFNKIVNKGQLVIKTSVPYAEYVDQGRSFTNWSQATIDSMKDDLTKYVSGKYGKT